MKGEGFKGEGFRVQGLVFGAYFGFRDLEFGCRVQGDGV